MLNKLSEPLQSKVAKFINGNGKKEILLKHYQIKMYNNNHIIFRIIDLLGCMLALILFSPILFFSSLLILIDSGFPILFKQKRIGKKGEMFWVYKFRTMRKDAEKILKNNNELYLKYVNNDYKLKPEEDPRILKFGNFLRKSSIDEIPQFINVLRGDMSLVGPRPIVADEIERYGEHADEFTSVKPGITGLWQVCGRSEINYPDRKYLDLIYIRNKSLILDIKIILKTFIVVFKKIGAH